MSSSKPSDAIAAKTAAGAGWIIGWRMATRVMGFVSTLVLARLLVPADFGLVALGTGFAQAVDALSMMGVWDAIVREENPGREMYDTAFTVNALRSLLTSGIIFALSWPVAQFFGDARLNNILLALAIGIIIGSLENIGTVDFRRDFAFEKEFQLFVVPRLASVIVTIVCAVIWPSYWDLVAGLMTNRVLRVIFSYTMHPFRPRASLAGWRHLFSFSFWTWVTSIVGLIRNRADSFAIGRLMGATAVGIFAVGNEVASLPSTELVEPISRALFPGFSAAIHSGSRIADSYLRVLALTFMVTMPTGLGVSLIADPLVRLAFGTKWLAAIPLVEIIALAATLRVVAYVSMTLFGAQGVPRVNAWISVVSTIVRVPLLVVPIMYYGLIGAALGLAAATVFEEALCVLVAFQRLHLKLSALVRALWRPTLASAVMAGVMVAAGLGWTSFPFQPGGAILRLLAAISLGAAVFTATLLLAWLASGRPVGAETDVLAGVRKAVFGLVRRGRRLATSVAG